MALKSTDGTVKFIMAAGNDFVMSSMTEEAANELIATAKKKEKSDLFLEYPLCVNDKYYLPVFDDAKEAETEEKKPKKQKR